MHDLIVSKGCLGMMGGQNKMHIYVNMGKLVLHGEELQSRKKRELGQKYMHKLLLGWEVGLGVR